MIQTTLFAVDFALYLHFIMLLLVTIIFNNINRTEKINLSDHLYYMHTQQLFFII